MPGPVERPTIPEPAVPVEPITGDYRSVHSTGIEPPSTLMTEAPVANTAARRGRFTILRTHARGGLGQVSLARDEKLKRNVALKEIRADRAGSADLRRRFITEAEITGMLEHPGIVPVYAMDDGPDGEPYYAMRFVAGKTLAEAIREFHGERGRVSAPITPRDQKLGALTQPRSPDFASSHFRQVLQRFVTVYNTIGYAHSKGVIHRDLKPANIMLGDYGETLVVDWGLAKRVSGQSPLVSGQPAEEKESTTDQGQLTTDHGQMTMQGQILGTPAYMSPEQARGEEISPATDIYALGAILYDLLTGRPPYVGSSAIQVLEQVRINRPTPPSAIQRRIPRALEAICLKALSRKPAGRYRGATELAHDVDRWLADERVTAYREPVGVRFRRWTRKHAVVTASAALLVLAILALLGVVVYFTHEQLRQAQESERTLAKERDAALASERDAKASFKFLVDDVLAVARPEGQEGGLGINVTVREALDAAAPKIPETFAGRPRAEATARTALGMTYLYLREHAAAIRELERARDLNRDVLGPTDPETLTTMNNLASAYHDAGRLAEALPLYEETLKLKKEHLGPTDPDTLLTVNNLASAYQDAGRRADALALFEDTLKLSRSSSGPRTSGRSPA